MASDEPITQDPALNFTASGGIAAEEERLAVATNAVGYMMSLGDAVTNGRSTDVSLRDAVPSVESSPYSTAMARLIAEHVLYQLGQYDDGRDGPSNGASFLEPIQFAELRTSSTGFSDEQVKIQAIELALNHHSQAGGGNSPGDVVATAAVFAAFIEGNSDG